MNARLDDQFDEEYPSIIGTLLAPITDKMQKPANIAWTVGAIVTIGFVYSNALFFQQGEHPAALFNTRTNAEEHSLRADEKAMSNIQSSAPAKQVTRIVFDKNGTANNGTSPLPKVAQRPNGDNSEPVASAEPLPLSSDLRDLQKSLVELGFYDGTVDGLDGPKTRAAIDKYKASVGLRGIDLTYAELALSAQNNLIVTAAIPKVRPQPQPASLPAKYPEEQAPVTAVKTTPYSPPQRGVDVVTPAKVDTEQVNLVSKVQAGLRAFGHNGISVDGVMGPMTVAAIQEFQSLFDLPMNGKVDDALIKKMADVGLIDR